MLERHANCCLSNAGWRGRDYAAEVRGAKYAVDCGWTEELGVVEGVEEFKTELYADGFVDWYSFCQSHVEVFLAGAVEEATLGVAGCAEWLEVQRRGVEEDVVIGLWMMIDR